MLRNYTTNALSIIRIYLENGEILIKLNWSSKTEIWLEFNNHIAVFSENKDYEIDIIRIE